ncbi:hypothetical protein OWV82_002187 [Melia azedarach]|uniref:Uncharacterized protein n=1 Tax=Melia azedarach TaxID=155640 RepID=A0ACC1Z280_MELAZ|nr:hypothetical protein OWV82_002187 [Melia azedarach]
MDDFENELERDRPGTVNCGIACITPVHYPCSKPLLGRLDLIGCSSLKVLFLLWFRPMEDTFQSLCRNIHRTYRFFIN